MLNDMDEAYCWRRGRSRARGPGAPRDRGSHHPATPEAVVQAVLGAFGGIDIIVNNAAIAGTA